MAEGQVYPGAIFVDEANRLIAIGDRISQDIAEGQALLRDIIHAIQTAHISRAEIPLEAPLQRPVQPSQHLREHRPGRPKKLAADPELRAFVETRFNRMTFDQIADDVAQNFPPERQVKRSAIHDWYRRVYKRKYQADPG